MNLIPLDIPEAIDDQRLWLEERMVSDDFSDFIIQLTTMNRTLKNLIPDNRPPEELLDQITDADRSEFYRNGFQSLDSETITTLLNHPSALMKLQEEIFALGGEYWQAKIRRNGARVDLDLGNSYGNSNQNVDVIPNPEIPTAAPTNTFPYWSLSIAALLLVTLSIVFVNWPDAQKPVAKANWGWLDDSGLSEPTDAKSYVDRLIVGANQWFDVELDSADQYEKRLTELRDGCQQLIDAEHPLLSGDQKEFLVDRCKEFQAKFNRQLGQLNQDRDDFKTIQRKTNQTIRNAIVALEEVTTA